MAIKARKKPIEILAIVWRGNNYPEVQEFCGQSYTYMGPNNQIEVLDKTRDKNGWSKVTIGDYIIKGIKGEVYPCAKQVFEESYEII